MHRVSNKFTWHQRQAADETEPMQPACCGSAITVALARCQSVLSTTISGGDQQIIGLIIAMIRF